MSTTQEKSAQPPRKRGFGSCAHCVDCLHFRDYNAVIDGALAQKLRYSPLRAEESSSRLERDMSEAHRYEINARLAHQLAFPASAARPEVEPSSLWSRRSATRPGRSRAPPAPLLPPVSCTGIDPKNARVTAVAQEPARKHPRFSDWGEAQQPGAGQPAAQAPPRAAAAEAAAARPEPDLWASVAALANAAPAQQPPAERAAAAAPRRASGPASAGGGGNSFWCAGAPMIVDGPTCGASTPLGRPDPGAQSGAEPTPLHLDCGESPTPAAAPAGPAAPWRAFRSTEWVDSPFSPAAARAEARPAESLASAQGGNRLRDDSARQADDAVCAALCKQRAAAGLMSPSAALLHPSASADTVAASAAQGASPRGRRPHAESSPDAGPLARPAPSRGRRHSHWDPAGTDGASSRGAPVPLFGSALPGPDDGLAHHQQQWASPGAGRRPRQQQQQGAWHGFAGSDGAADDGRDWRRTQTALLSALVKTWCYSSVGPPWLRGIGGAGHP